MLPITEYLINYNYIVNELCENRDKPILTCNGKCYLEDQVKLHQELEHHQNTLTPPKFDLEEFITIKIIKLCSKNTFAKQMQQTPIFYNMLIGRLFVDALFKPPKY